jgi:hypothetical protein
VIFLALSDMGDSPMNQTSPPSEHLKPEPVQTPPASPLPTPLGSQDTSQNSIPPLTGSFHPTISLSASDSESVHPGIRFGESLDGYVLIEQIGRGGMGIVFKAKQPASDQIVALKMIRDGVFADQDSHNRFLQEVRAMGRFQSAKNIVPIYHVGQHLGHLFYVMPFLTGGCLSKKQKRYPNQPHKAVALVEKVARAVHQLHLSQVLHRDIKPSNILLDADEEPYLSDFGLAKLLDQDQVLTASQQRLGTPAYMAPEQTGLLPIPMSPRTDIWALGVLLYELLTGKRPFAVPEAEISTTLLWKIVNESPPRPRKLQPDLAPGLEAVILKCLEKQPADRYASAEELADELARWLRQEKLHTPPVSIGASTRRFMRRHPWLMIASAIMIVGVAVAAAVSVEVRRRDTPEYIHESIRSELIDKEAVVLVPNQGSPKWFHSVFTQRVMTSLDHEGNWTIDSPDVGLIELLREIPFDSYKFRAEIRHSKSSLINGHVGLFLGHQTFTHNENTAYIWGSLTYNDLVDSTRGAPKIPGFVFPKGNTTQFMHDLYADNGAVQSLVDRWAWSAVRFEVPAGPPQGNTWRVLEIERRPDEILCRFDDRALPAQSRTFVEQSILSDLKERQAKDAKYQKLGDLKNLQLSKRGSLGLVISNGSIAVKNVTVIRTHNND